MGEFTAIVGKSGVGKSTSYSQIPKLGIKGLDPKETVIINVAAKPLPVKGWKNLYNPDIKITDGGNYIATSDYKTIINVIKHISAKRPEIKQIILEDGQYIMAFEFMSRASEKGFDKFTELGVHFNEIRDAITAARHDLKVFTLWHSDHSEDTGLKMKSVGRIVDAYLTLEGLFTVILYAISEKDMVTNTISYKFITNNDGFYPAKSPIGMFDEISIPNDLGLVVECMDNYNLGE